MSDDPIDTTEAGDEHWTTTNTEEAHPGVLTPLGWTVAGPGIELCTRAGLRAIGVLTEAEARIPTRPSDRAFAVFSGRFAGRLGFFVEVGNRLPGTDGVALVEQVFSFVPPGAVAQTDRSRYAAIATRIPVAFITSPRRARRARADVAAWWPGATQGAATLDLAGARRAFAEAYRRFLRVGSLDGELLLASIQPIYDRLTRLATLADIPSGPLMSGHGSHEESRLVADIWACSRDRLDFATLLARHGYHGPRTGELSAPSWREHSAPLRAAVERYAAMPDDAEPAAAERSRAAERESAERELLAALPATRRPGAALLLRLAQAYLPLRGKTGRTQALDGMRAAARRIGELLPLADPDDVFMLTTDELAGSVPALEVLRERRARYEGYQALTLPRVWQGRPTPIPAGTPDTGDHVPSWTAVGASPGRVEGPARVVTDPATANVDPGEILVAHVTDPSWASIMYGAAGMIVDVGGLLSHAAVVARELGIPCVMDTQDGTRTIRTGDLCRIDGTTGTVEILARASG